MQVPYLLGNVRPLIPVKDNQDSAHNIQEPLSLRNQFGESVWGISLGRLLLVSAQDDWEPKSRPDLAKALVAEWAVLATKEQLG